MEKLFDGEYKLMEVLWEAGAVHSAQLVELCAQRLGWNKSTTYTVLRRLKNKGAVDHRDTVVTPLLTRAAAIRAEGCLLYTSAGRPRFDPHRRPAGPGPSGAGPGPGPSGRFGRPSRPVRPPGAASTAAGDVYKRQR